MTCQKKKKILLNDLYVGYFLNSTIGQKLEKEIKYKYLDADDFHSQSNKGVCI